MDKYPKYHHGHSGGFSSGFLLGAAIGGASVFLLGTKKGREVLKTLTENGLEGISEFKDILREETDDFVQENMDNAEVISEELKSEPVQQEVNKATKSIKRFFRGIKR